MKPLFFISFLFLFGCYMPCWAQLDVSGHSLFFTNQYRNPALSSGLNTNYLDGQAFKPGANGDFKDYLAMVSANVHLPRGKSNLGLSYQTQDLPWAAKQKLNLHFGHRIRINDSSLLNAAVQLSGYQFKDHFFQQEDLLFPDQFLPCLGPVFATNAHIKEFPEPEKQYALTENLGLWYQTPRYYAGVSIANFITLAEDKTRFETRTTYPLALNATFARHFHFGRLTISPAFSYHYQTRDQSLHYSHAPGVDQLHQFQPALIAQYNDRYFLKFSPQFELINAYENRTNFNNYQVQAGVKFWDRLLVRAQIRLPRSNLFGRYQEELLLGTGITCFLPEFKNL